jgi:hypothetical protein
MQPLSSPDALKEQTLSQLLEIRDTLLNQEWQEKIDTMPHDRRHEIIILVSQAQINFLKLRRAELEAIANGLKKSETELFAGMKQMQDSMDDVSKVDAFVNGAAGFLRLVQDILKAVTPLI